LPIFCSEEIGYRYVLETLPRFLIAGNTGVLFYCAAIPPSGGMEISDKFAAAADAFGEISGIRGWVPISHEQVDGHSVPWSVGGDQLRGSALENVEVVGARHLVRSIIIPNRHSVTLIIGLVI
jgi:hypothetical protein